MTTGIRLTCHRCSSEVDSSQQRDGICHLCLLRARLEPDLLRYGRLWTKYLDWPAVAKPRLRQQLTEMSKRIRAKIGEVVLTGAAADLHNALLDEARARAESRGTHIRVAHSTSLLARR